jgi:tetratricopeptide (TPR) repeat protein
MVAFKRTSSLVLALFLFAACKGSDEKITSAADASAPIWPLSTKSEEARSHIELGERASDEGRILDAYEQFKRAVASDSAFAYGYLRVADLAQSFDEYKTNLERAKAYESTANPTEKVLIDISQKLFVRDQQGALDLARQLVALQPKNPRAYWVLSNQQFTTGDLDGARSSAKTAVEIAPGYGGTHLFLGSLWLAEPKDVAKAEQEVLAGQKLWPDKPLSYNYLGDVRRAQGRLQEAADAYSREIELAPKEAEGYDQRGHAYTFLGSYDKARADYDAATRLAKGNAPVSEATYRAYVDVYAGEPEAGLSRLEQLFRAVDGMGVPEPDGVKSGVLDEERIIASHIHKFDVAERATAMLDSLTRKLAARSGNSDVKRQAEGDVALDEARLAAFKGDYAAVGPKVATFMKLTTSDRNPTKNRYAHAVLGFSAFFQKRYDEAVKEFAQADPQNPYSKYFKGLALEGAGRTAEAKAVFREVANYNFNNPGYALVRNDAVKRAQ